MQNLYECPVCELRNGSVRIESEGGTLKVKCARCGNYSLTADAGSLLSRSKKVKRRSELSGWIRERTSQRRQAPNLTRDATLELEASLPPLGPLDKQHRLMRSLAVLSKYAGYPVQIQPEVDLSLAWATNEAEFVYLLEALRDRGLVKCYKASNAATPADGANRKLPTRMMQITPKGWEYLEEISSPGSTKSQAFVAINFDGDLREVYKRGLCQGIEDAGYIPCPGSFLEPDDKIDDRVISEIRNSRFLVADVTSPTPEIYYEAGFAQGLGIPVIWTLNAGKEFEGMPFDTGQYKPIIWDDFPQLAECLAFKIRALIGQGPRWPPKR